MKESFISLFDVLENDPQNEGLRVIQNDFVEIKSKLKTLMDSGLPPDEMKIANELYLATQSVMKVLESSSV